MHKEEKSSSSALLSIFLSSYCAMLVTHPLEVVKVRLQKDKAICNSIQNYEAFACAKNPGTSESICECIPHSSTFRALEYLGKSEGVSTLWSGLRERSLMSLNPMVHFPLMEKIRAILFKTQWFPEQLVSLTAAGIARSVTILLTFPLEYMATLKQANESISFQKMKQFAVGIEPLILRDIGFSMVMWAVTDAVRKSLSTKSRSETKPSETLLVNAVAGSIGGVTASLSTYPLDVLKTRWQVIDSLQENPQKQSIITSLRHIYENEGVESFYYGLGAKVSRSAIAGGVVIGFYEFFYQIIQDARRK